ncbi:hypothetical protein P7C70_g894, partial [Phenoliferia sp. Uapishka_3]
MNSTKCLEQQLPPLASRSMKELLRQDEFASDIVDHSPEAEIHQLRRGGDKEREWVADAALRDYGVQSSDQQPSLAAHEFRPRAGILPRAYNLHTRIQGKRLKQNPRLARLYKWALTDTSKTSNAAPQTTTSDPLARSARKSKAKEVTFDEFVDKYGSPPRATSLGGPSSSTLAEASLPATGVGLLGSLFKPGQKTSHFHGASTFGNHQATLSANVVPDLLSTSVDDAAEMETIQTIEGNTREAYHLDSPLLFSKAIATLRHLPPNTEDAKHSFDESASFATAPIPPALPRVNQSHTSTERSNNVQMKDERSSGAAEWAREQAALVKQSFDSHAQLQATSHAMAPAPNDDDGGVRRARVESIGRKLDVEEETEARSGEWSEAQATNQHGYPAIPPNPRILYFNSVGSNAQVTQEVVLPSSESSSRHSQSHAHSSPPSSQPPLSVPITDVASVQSLANKELAKSFISSFLDEALAKSSAGMKGTGLEGDVEHPEPLAKPEFVDCSLRLDVEGPNICEAHLVRIGGCEIGPTCIHSHDLTKAGLPIDDKDALIRTLQYFMKLRKDERRAVGVSGWIIQQFEGGRPVVCMNGKGGDLILRELGATRLGRTGSPVPGSAEAQSQGWNRARSAGNTLATQSQPRAQNPSQIAPPEIRKESNVTPRAQLFAGLTKKQARTMKKQLQIDNRPPTVKGPGKKGKGKGKAKAQVLERNPPAPHPAQNRQFVPAEPPHRQRNTPFPYRQQVSFADE